MSKQEEPQPTKVVQLLTEHYADQILFQETAYDFPVLVLKKDKIIDIIGFLYNHDEAKFQYLTTLCGIHYAELNQIAVMYQLHNMFTNERVRLKVFLPVENPVIPTLTPVFAAANWMERETFDFYGVIFEGHPKLKRILNVEDMIIHPLRKEYPLEDQTREDKEDFMFGR
jgi:NADH-quinone oxidoreductase subunit C